MEHLTLTKARDCIARDDRAGALGVLRAAIQDGDIAPRDGVELMLAVRRGSRDTVLEAIDSIQWNKSGAYRFIPGAVHAFA